MGVKVIIDESVLPLEQPTWAHLGHQSFKYLVLKDLVKARVISWDEYESDCNEDNEDQNPTKTNSCEDFVNLIGGPEPRPIFQSSWLLSSHTSGSPSWPTPPPDWEVLNILCPLNRKYSAYFSQTKAQTKFKTYWIGTSSFGDSPADPSSVVDILFSEFFLKKVVFIWQGFGPQGIGRSLVLRLLWRRRSGQCGDESQTSRA